MMSAGPPGVRDSSDQESPTRRRNGDPTHPTRSQDNPTKVSQEATPHQEEVKALTRDVSQRSSQPSSSSSFSSSPSCTLASSSHSIADAICIPCAECDVTPSITTGGTIIPCPGSLTSGSDHLSTNDSPSVVGSITRSPFTAATCVTGNRISTASTTTRSTSTSNNPSLIQSPITIPSCASNRDTTTTKHPYRASPTRKTSTRETTISPLSSSRREAFSPLVRGGSLLSSSRRIRMGRPSLEANGHALPPRGALESRDAPRNPGPLPTAPSTSTIHHRERLIGPVVANVAPPPLRMADAHRQMERLSFASRRLMNKSVKRKLWEVDHDTLGPEIEAEYRQIIEDDEKRFRERWEETGPEEIPGAPRFYWSETITTNKKDAAKPSSVSSPSSVPPSSSSTSSIPGNGSGITTSVETTSDVKSSSNAPSTSDADTPSPPKAKHQKKDCSEPGVSKSSVTPSEVVFQEKQGQGGVVSESNLPSEKQKEDQNILPSEKKDQDQNNIKRQRISTSSSSSVSSPSISTASFYSSSLNLSSTSSRSSSGVSSMESTPTQTIAPWVESTSPMQEVTPTPERIVSIVESTTTTRAQRPTTRSSHRRSSQRTDSRPLSQRHLRM